MINNRQFGGGGTVSLSVICLLVQTKCSNLNKVSACNAPTLATDSLLQTIELNLQSLKRERGKQLSRDPLSHHTNPLDLEDELRWKAICFVGFLLHWKAYLWGRP